MPCNHETSPYTSRCLAIIGFNSNPSYVCAICIAALFSTTAVNKCRLLRSSNQLILLLLNSKWEICVSTSFVIPSERFNSFDPMRRYYLPSLFCPGHKDNKRASSKLDKLYRDLLIQADTCDELRVYDKKIWAFDISNSILRLHHLCFADRYLIVPDFLCYV